MEIVMRELLLQGKIDLKSYDKFVDTYGIEDSMTTRRMIKALWSNYIKNGDTTSSIYWAEQFSSPKILNNILSQLDYSGWINVSTVTERHWSEISINEDKLLTYLSSDELMEVRKTKKFKQYVPEHKLSTKVNMTKVNRTYKDTGLIRIGLAMAANTEFYYDCALLNKYKKEIILNTNKGMRKCRELLPDMVHDSASYDEIAVDVVEGLAKEPMLMTMEGNTSDSRGRSIKGALSKVANPIGYKDFRALLTIPE